MVTSSLRSPFCAIVGFSTIVAAGILTSPTVAAARDRVDDQTRSLSANRLRIWEDRGPIEQLDLFWAGGSRDRIPVGPFFTPDSKHVVYFAVDTAARQTRCVIDGLEGQPWQSMPAAPAFRDDGTIQYLGVREGTLYRITVKLD